MRHVIYWLLPDSVKRCMTISTDMLVLSDVSDYYNMNLEGKTVGVTIFHDQSKE